MGMNCLANRSMVGWVLARRKSRSICFPLMMASVGIDFTFEMFVVDTMLDESPNQLKDSTEHLELVDTAFFFDTSCPPLLRPERKVDVILHFNYTGGSQTKVRRHNAGLFVMK